MKEVMTMVKADDLLWRHNVEIRLLPYSRPGEWWGFKIEAKDQKHIMLPREFEAQIDVEILNGRGPKRCKLTITAEYPVKIDTKE